MSSRVNVSIDHSFRCLLVELSCLFSYVPEVRLKPISSRAEVREESKAREGSGRLGLNKNEGYWSIDRVGGL